MTAFDLSSIGAEASAELREIRDGPDSVATRCTLRREAGALQVRVEARDEHMLDLIATAPRPGVVDRFLYEEDCVQMAVAAAGAAEARDFVLVNPHGSAVRAGAAEGWAIETQRHGDGWRVDVRLPIPGDTPALGLSLHRFYRGVHHEVQGLAPTVPHPLDVSRFPVLLLARGADAEAHRAAAREAQAIQLEAALRDVRERLARRKRIDPPWTALAAEFARRRAAIAVNPDTRFLCWNEQHYQSALLGLWELQRDPRWLELAIERMETVWSFTGERLGTRDAVWGEPLPTWYDERDELGAAISLITGVILFPIARLIRAVWSQPDARHLWPRVEPWLERCRRAIAVHDREWIELPGESGIYLEPYVKGSRRVYPTGGSRVAPLNRAFFLAMPLLDLGRVLGDEAYLDKARRMARYFRHAWEITPDGAAVWEYLVSRYPATGEDISHASCQVHFADHCRPEGIEFGEADMERLAVTLERNVFHFGDVPCGEVRGLAPALDPAVGAWAGLCRYRPALLPRIEAVVETALTESPALFDKNGWGIRLLTMVEHARASILAGSLRDPGGRQT